METNVRGNRRLTKQQSIQIKLIKSRPRNAWSRAFSGIVRLPHGPTAKDHVSYSGQPGIDNLHGRGLQECSMVLTRLREGAAEAERSSGINNQETLGAEDSTNDTPSSGQPGINPVPNESYAASEVVVPLPLEGHVYVACRRAP